MVILDQSPSPACGKKKRVWEFVLLNTEQGFVNFPVHSLGELLGEGKKRPQSQIARHIH